MQDYLFQETDHLPLRSPLLYSVRRNGMETRRDSWKLRAGKLSSQLSYFSLQGWEDDTSAMNLGLFSFLFLHQLSCIVSFTNQPPY